MSDIKTVWVVTSQEGAVLAVCASEERAELVSKFELEDFNKLTRTKKFEVLEA